MGLSYIQQTEDEVQLVKLDWQEASRTHWDWVFPVFIGVLLIWGLTKLYKPRQLGELVQTFFSNRFTRQIMREDGVLRSDIHLVLLINSVIVTSLFFTLNILHFKPENLEYESFQLFLLVAGLISAVLVLRFFANNLVNFILRSEALTEFNFNIILFHLIQSVLLFFSCLAVVYVKDYPKVNFLYIGWGILSLMYIVRLGKTFYIGLISYKLPLFYIVLYLCALEIYPLVLLTKLSVKVLN